MQIIGVNRNNMSDLEVDEKRYCPVAVDAWDKNDCDRNLKIKKL